VTQAQIESAVMVWVNSLSLGCPVIWLDQNFPRQSLPYVGLRIDNLEIIHQDFQSKVDDLGVSNIGGDREFRLIFEAYGPGAFDIISSAVNSLEKYSVNVLLNGESLVYKDSGQIVDVSELLDMETEKRYRSEIFFRFRHQDTDDVGLIETVQTEDSYLDSDLSTITIDLNTITIA
jgi:hypothetical protein